MDDNKHTCPRCGEKMYWTGDVSQNPNENRWCSVVYVYQCRNIDCGYKSKYENLDSAGIRLKQMTEMGR